jgi:hypothetical protein
LGVDNVLSLRFGLEWVVDHSNTRVYS